jgi:hypothetical protein
MKVIQCNYELYDIQMGYEWIKRTFGINTNELERTMDTLERRWKGCNEYSWTRNEKGSDTNKWWIVMNKLQMVGKKTEGECTDYETCGWTRNWWE